MTEVEETFHQEVPKAAPRKEIPLLVKAGMPIGSLVLFLATACNRGEKESTQIISPPTQPDQPQATQTTTAMPSTETPLVTPKESPVPSETPIAKELPASNWQVIVDPQIEGTVSEHPFNRTVEQDLAIINAALNELPKIGEVKIILTDSDRPSFNNEPEIPEIYVTRKNFPDYMKYRLFHELAHLWDPEANYQQLPKLLTETELEELRELRRRVLSGPIFTPNVPYMEKIFTAEKSMVSWDFSKNYTPEQLAALVTIDPDIYWLIQGHSVDNTDDNTDNTRSRLLFKPFLQNSLDLIESYAQEPGLAEYDSLEGFMNANKTRLDSLAVKDPIFAEALDILRTKQQLFTFKNLLWTGGQVKDFKIGGKYTADWWHSLPYLVNGVLAQGIMTEDTQVASLFGNQARQLKVDLENLKGATEVERFAELGSATLMFNVETPFTPYLDKLKSIAAKSSSK